MIDNTFVLSELEKRDLINLVLTPKGLNMIVAPKEVDIDIENLSTEKLSFELGAGETEIQDLNVSKECEIE